MPVSVGLWPLLVSLGACAGGLGILSLGLRDLEADGAEVDGAGDVGLHCY